MELEEVFRLMRENDLYYQYLLNKFIDQKYKIYSAYENSLSDRDQYLLDKLYERDIYLLDKLHKRNQ